MEPDHAAHPLHSIGESAPIVAPQKNPFTGLQIYLVGNVAGDLLFQVQWPDKTFLSIRESELVALGFEVARVGTAMAKVTFESELIYALPKPSTAMVAERSQPVPAASGSVN